MRPGSKTSTVTGTPYQLQDQELPPLQARQA